MNTISLSEINAKEALSQITGKTVFVRTDFNVPLSDDGKVLDDTRILAAIPTLELLIQYKCKVVIASHLGRPEGAPDTAFSLKPIVAVLNKSLDHVLDSDITFCDEAIGLTRQACLEEMAPGSVVLLENLRFYPGEQKNESSFAKELAKGIDIFVNEAFSVSHRADASVVGLPKLVPAFAGLALAKEVHTWNNLMKNPERPFVMIIGGAKISDKVAAVEHLTDIADAILVGGGTANNFLKAEGLEIYQSYLEEDNASGKKGRAGANYVKVAAHLLEENRADKIIIDGFIPLPKIIMPSDVIAADSMESTNTQVVELTSSDVISGDSDSMYLDIGPKTIALFKEVIEEAGTIFWNGPLGVFEEKQFSNGTREIAEAIVKSKAFSIIGGGDTLGAVDSLGLLEKFDYVSVAGGAALEFLSGKTLPGLKELYKNNQ